MKRQASQLEALLLEMRLGFNRLKALAESMHADTGISAPARAVLEQLGRDGPQTAPQIARARGVTRQHIQAIADSLIADGLLTTKINPHHKRSVLLVTTPAGKRAYADIRRRESHILEALAAGLTADDVERATATLRDINIALADLVRDSRDDADDA